MVAGAVYNEMAMKSYIVSDPKILGGKPVIIGTRIPVSRIIFLLSEGYTPELIHEQYPFVSVATIAGTVTELMKRVDDKEYAA